MLAFQHLKKISWPCVVTMTLLCISMSTESHGQEEENSDPNTNIVRWSKGKILFQTLSDQRQRGTEDWHLMVHPDGSRTLQMVNDIYATNSMHMTVLRVANDFRPVEAYISYWTQNGFKGSGIFTVSGNKLDAIVTGPTGRVTRLMPNPS